MKIHNIQITGSSGISGNQSITGSLTVTGDIIAQQYVVSSSVVHLTQSFASGSHIFGNSLDDTHQFTGSVLVSGSLGVGTANPSQLFEVVGGEIKAGRVDSTNEGGQVSFGRSTDNNTSWYIDAYGNVASPQLRFVNVSDSLVAMTITGSRVGVGTSTPNAPLQISSATGTNVNPAVNITNTSLNGYGVLRLTGNSRGGFIDFYNNSSAQASIVGQGGAFYVYTNGDSSGTPKASVLANGDVGIGTEPLTKLHVLGGNVAALFTGNSAESGGYSGILLSARNTQDSSGQYCVELRATNTNGTPGFLNPKMEFLVQNNNSYLAADRTVKMTITGAGSIGAPSGTNIYNASDIRLKQNISTTTYGLNTIAALNPVKFNWVDGFESSEDGKDLLGFIAQEVQAIIPEAVESFGGDVNLNDTIVTNPLRVNEKFIIPVLVKAIQEQQELIQSLQSRLDTLENA
jgi:hypothetical protein